MKIQAASGFFEYFDSDIGEPPWWPTFGILVEARIGRRAQRASASADWRAPTGP